MRKLIVAACLLLVAAVVSQEPGPAPRVVKSDAEFRAAVNYCLAYPGHPFVIDDGLTVKAWPSYDKAVQVPDYFSGGAMYRAVFVVDGGAPLVLGAETMDGIRVIIAAVAKANAGRRVIVAISEPAGAYRWLNADGSPCKDQDSGPQFRAAECRVNVGSITLP